MCNTTLIERMNVKREEEEEARSVDTQQRHSGPTRRSRLHHGDNRLSRFSSLHTHEDNQSVDDRRVLRARYRAVRKDIPERNLDPDSFEHAFKNMEKLYTEVRCPREQISDAEALHDITAAILASVKEIKNSRNGRTTTEFVSAIMTNFGRDAMAADGRIEPIVDWEALGHEACAVFSDAPGINTMIGPMESQEKQRKLPQRRRRDKATQTARPEELSNFTSSAKMTERNMETMFMILRQLKAVYLEELVVNRSSFAQTVENIFALSFLVKDGRAEISIKNGRHVVGPKNFPTQRDREQGKGSMSQFVFRFDFRDWQAMKEVVEEGKQLMPHRENELRHR